MNENRVIAADESSLGNAVGGGTMGMTVEGGHIVDALVVAFAPADRSRAAASTSSRANAASPQRRGIVLRTKVNMRRTSSSDQRSGRWSGATLGSRTNEESRRHQGQTTCPEIRQGRRGIRGELSRQRSAEHDTAPPGNAGQASG